MIRKSTDTTRYHYRDTVTVSWRRVSDWYAVDRDTLIGGFTIRYERLTPTKAERAQFDSANHYVIGDDAANLRRLPRNCDHR